MLKKAIIGLGVGCALLVAAAAFWPQQEKSMTVREAVNLLQAAASKKVPTKEDAELAQLKDTADNLAIAVGGLTHHPTAGDAKRGLKKVLKN